MRNVNVRSSVHAARELTANTPGSAAKAKCNP